MIADDEAGAAANQNGRTTPEAKGGEMANGMKRGRQAMDVETVRRIDQLAKAYFQKTMDDAESNARLVDMVNSFKG